MCNPWWAARLVLDVLGVAMIACVAMGFYVWRMPYAESLYRGKPMSDVTD